MVQIGTVSADIQFRSSAVERIFAEPEQILADIDSLWDTEEALRCAKGWHDVVGIPVDYALFRNVVKEIAALTPKERETHPALLVTRLAMAEEERFVREGIPHLCLFLPDNPAKLEIRVLFAAGLRANAFVYEHAVINATSKHWHATGLPLADRASSILNLVVHECWHGGYCENRTQWTEAPLADEVLYRLLINIQNEGTATYVNYCARAVFPSPGDPDFAMLDDPDQVAAKLAGMNEILQRRGALSPDALRELVWQEGVLGRAFYIGGAHMARTLDERAGRRGLTATIGTGPASFFDAYNAVADGALRVRLAPE